MGDGVQTPFLFSYSIKFIWQKEGNEKVLANQILQKTVRDIAEITDVDCSVWNDKGVCLAYSNSEKKEKNELEQQVRKMDGYDERIGENESFFSVYSEEGLTYVLVLHSTAKEMEMVGKMGVKQLEGLLHAYHEKMNRNQFIQNLLLDNMLLVDVYNRARKMRIDIEARRAVFLIQPKNPGENLVMEVLKGVYATSTKEFITAVDENHIVFVKALKDCEDYKALNETAKYIADILNTEAMVSVRVAYGTIVNEIKDVSKSYKEAALALDVGRIFYEEKNILAYNELGIGRLIHQLPVSLCDMFLKEVFAGNAVEEFDEETLVTVHKFFENNLNISETARQLFLHRNTLVYRLEKIQKKTGLDVRVFDDALTFKIALMVSAHMKALQTKE